MPRRLRRSFLLLPLAVALLATGTPPAAAAGSDPVTGAAGWLTTQFVGAAHLPTPSGDHFDSKFGSSYFPNYGENADVLFGLAAAKAGKAKASVALNYLDAHLADYADPSGTAGGPYDGALAKVALARIVEGTSASALLTQLKADECPSGSSTCTPGAPANIFASASDSFVILAEARAGGSFAPSSLAVSYLLSLQCASGGFTTGTDACGSGAADLDATSYAIMALQALGGHAAALTKAANWLVAQRNAGGYWISQDVPNANTTGLATAALAGAGRGVSTSRAWLRAQQVPAGKPGAGALKYGGAFTPTTTSATSPSVLATAQGLLGLVNGASLATLTAAGSASSAPLLAPVAAASDPTVHRGQHITVTGTGFAAGERVRAALAGTGTLASATADASGVAAVSLTIPARTPGGADRVALTGASSGLTAIAAITVQAPGGGTGTPVPSTPGGPTLADTGARGTDLLPVGLLLLAAGAVLSLAGRRRARHG